MFCEVNDTIQKVSLQKKWPSEYGRLRRGEIPQSYVPFLVVSYNGGSGNYQKVCISKKKAQQVQ